MTTRTPRPPSVLGGNLLSQVYEGMAVYNDQGDEIAAVDAVYFGAIGDESPASGNAPATVDRPLTTSLMPTEVFAKVIRNVFDPGEIPDEVAERLRYSGFARLDGGFFGNDRYIVPDQIDTITADGVHLKVPEAVEVEEV